MKKCKVRILKHWPCVILKNSYVEILHQTFTSFFRCRVTEICHSGHNLLRLEVGLDVLVSSRSFAAASQVVTLTRVTNERVVLLGRLVAGQFSSVPFEVQQKFTQTFDDQF